MQVHELMKELSGAEPDAEVTFQANVPGEEDGPGQYTYTIATGSVFSAFSRTDKEFVIDGAVTWQEG